MPRINIADELHKAKTGVRETDSEPLIGWAWKDPGYRASRTRAFRGQNGALTLVDEGMLALEAAMAAILRDQHVRANWRDEDVWTTVLSLLAAAWADAALDLDTAVGKILAPTPVRHFAALANVSWRSGLASFGDLTIARIRSESDATALGAAVELDAQSMASLLAHSRKLLSASNEYVVVTSTSRKQGELAHEDFERTIEDCIGLTLMLSERLDEYGIYPVRGATNRPGIRGTTLDRAAIGDLLTDKGANELHALHLVLTGWGATNSFHWHSSDPLPLDRLLDNRLSNLLTDLMCADDAIAQRLRVAARWYSKAFWADTQEDTALAVSIALDCLLTGKDALPGAVSKNRFALLERDPNARAARFARYDEVYGVRSTIAHGGDSSRQLSKIGGAQSILADARWVAAQLLNLRLISVPKTDAEFRELWFAVQWGTISWASEESSHGPA